MPRIQQYVAQEASRGRALNTSRVTPEGTDISGAARGISDAASTLTRLKEVQDRERRELEANEARMSVANTMSEASVMWTERLQNAQQSAPRDAAGFTETALKDFDGWVKQKTEGAMHPDARRLLEANLTKMRQGIHADAFKFEIGQRNKALIGDFEEGLDADRRAVLADPMRFTDTLARRRATAQAMNLPAEAREKLADHARDTLAFDAANGLVDIDAAGFLERAGVRSAKGTKGKQGGRAQDAAERIASDPILSSLQPERLRQVVDRASMLVAQQEQAREAAQLRALAEQDRRLRQAEAEFNVFQSLADKGTALAPEYVTKALQATAGTPYAEGIRKLAQQAQETGGYARQPIGAQRAMLDAVDAEIAQKGRSPALDKRRDALAKVVRGTEADIKADPLTAGLQRGVITQFSPIQFGGGIDGLVPQVQARIVQADAVGRWAGKPVSPFTADETRELFSRISQQPAPQRAQTLATLASTMPKEQADALAAQLDGGSKSDASRAYAAALQSASDRTTAGRYTSEIILKGAEALQAKTIKEERTPVDGWRGRIGKITGEAYRNPQEAEFVADKARFILAGLVAEGASGSERDVSKAVTLAAGGQIRDHNGQRVVLPAGMESSDFRDRLRKMPPASLGLPDGKVYVNTGAGMQEMTAEQFITTLPDAKLTYWKRGRYFVQAGGSFAAKADGNPVVIEVGP